MAEDWNVLTCTAGRNPIRRAVEEGVKRGAAAKERTRRLERDRADRDLELRIARRLMVVE